MAVSPQIVRDAVTEIVKCELQQIAELLVVHDDRIERAKILDNVRENLHNETKTFLFLTEQREHEHIEFVNYLLDFIPEFILDCMPEFQCESSKNKYFKGQLILFCGCFIF